LVVKAPDWLVDPYDLTVDQAAATTISTNLATPSVTLKTMVAGTSGPGHPNASGVGDIHITPPIPRANAQPPRPAAHQRVTITAPITATGAGKVVLVTNDGGTGGDYSFGLTASGFAGRLSFTGTPNTGQSLTVNGQAYTLLYSVNDLIGINNSSGFAALVQDI